MCSVYTYMQFFYMIIINNKITPLDDNQTSLQNQTNKTSTFVL